MNTNNTCPNCGKPLKATDPLSMCPACLFAGVASPTDHGPTAQPTVSSGSALDLTEAEIARAFPGLEILGKLGSGGMGAVFKARQSQLDRIVALKVLPRGTSVDADFRERFKREGRLLARLDHPNIVRVFDYGESSGYPFLAMEYVDGVNLRQAMRAGRFTLAQALGVVPRICEALAYAHGEGILHRDIKPENILLDTRGRVKIADFGIAKLVGEAGPQRHLTAVDATLGTPHYMAPEQLEKPAEVDHRADIFSLGVVFYEMLTGELPLGQFAKPSEKTPLDPQVDKVVMRALAKERERRQQSADEIRTQVEKITVNQRTTAAAEAKAATANERWPWSTNLALAAAVFFFAMPLAASTQLGDWVEPRGFGLLVAISAGAYALWPGYWAPRGRFFDGLRRFATTVPSGVHVLLIVLLGTSAAAIARKISDESSFGSGVSEASPAAVAAPKSDPAQNTVVTPATPAPESKPEANATPAPLPLPKTSALQFAIRRLNQLKADIAELRRSEMLVNESVQTAERAPLAPPNTPERTVQDLALEKHNNAVRAIRARIAETEAEIEAVTLNLDREIPAEPPGETAIERADRATDTASKIRILSEREEQLKGHQKTFLDSVEVARRGLDSEENKLLERFAGEKSRELESESERLEKTLRSLKPTPKLGASPKALTNGDIHHALDIERIAPTAQRGKSAFDEAANHPYPHMKRSILDKHRHDLEAQLRSLQSGVEKVREHLKTAPPNPEHSQLLEKAEKRVEELKAELYRTGAEIKKVAPTTFNLGNGHKAPPPAPMPTPPRATLDERAPLPKPGESALERAAATSSPSAKTAILIERLHSLRRQVLSLLSGNSILESIPAKVASDQFKQTRMASLPQPTRDRIALLETESVQISEKLHELTGAALTGKLDDAFSYYSVPIAGVFDVKAHDMLTFREALGRTGEDFAVLKIHRGNQTFGEIHYQNSPLWNLPVLPDDRIEGRTFKEFQDQSPEIEPDFSNFKEQLDFHRKLREAFENAPAVVGPVIIEGDGVTKAEIPVAEGATILISKAILQAGLREGTNLDSVEVHRAQSSKTINPKVTNISLRPGDRVTVKNRGFLVTDRDTQDCAIVAGAVQRFTCVPVKWIENQTLKDFIQTAGGFTEKADKSRVIVHREKAKHTLDLSGDNPKDAEFTLQAADIVAVSLQKPATDGAQQ